MVDELGSIVDVKCSAVVVLAVVVCFDVTVVVTGSAVDDLEKDRSAEGVTVDDIEEDRSAEGVTVDD